MATAQEDIEHGHLEHADSAPATQQQLQTLSAVVSKNAKLLKSLGIVLNKVQVIATVTAKAVDVFAKVDALSWFAKDAGS